MALSKRPFRAQIALDAYIEAVNDPVPDSDGSYLTDLLTDLMHRFGRKKFTTAVRMAEIHWDCERNGKE